MDPIANALGFVDATARFQDGREETVQVRIVPIRQVGTLARSIDNPAEVISLCCGKRPQWVDSLTDDSVYEIDKIAREINRPRMARWLDRQGALLIDASKDFKTEPTADSPSPTQSPSAP